MRTAHPSPVDHYDDRNRPETSSARENRLLYVNLKGTKFEAGIQVTHLTLMQ